jgi:hypothetical protein
MLQGSNSKNSCDLIAALRWRAKAPREQAPWGFELPGRIDH